MGFLRKGAGCGAERGQILPLVLVLLAAAVFIIVPGLFSAQIALGVNRAGEKDSRGYYAAEAGVADALWKFKSGSPPFSPASSPGYYYPLTSSMNGMDVRVTLLKYSFAGGADNYLIQSAALSGPTVIAVVVSTIVQQGSAGNNVFDGAVVSLAGNVSMSGSSQVDSDDTSVSYGDVYANGSITTSKYGPAIGGNASATGSIDSRIAVGGTRHPGVAAITAPAIDVAAYQQQAHQGQTVASFSKSSGTWNLGGPGNPGYVTGDLSLSGTATAVIAGTVYVGGKITVGRGATMSGGNSVLCNGNITLDGDSPGELPKGSVPLVMSANGAVTISNGATLSAIVYAPKGAVSLSGDGRLWGAAVGKSVSLAGGARVTYETGMRGWNQLPGSGQGGATRLEGYDYR